MARQKHSSLKAVGVGSVLAIAVLALAGWTPVTREFFRNNGDMLEQRLIRAAISRKRRTGSQCDPNC